jgi:hypothetical protein
MWALFALIVISMAVVVAFGWEFVAAITPWRASALLMPLALAVITARGVTWVASDRPWRERQVMITCTLLAVSAIAYGFWRQTERWSRYAGAESMPPIRWIQAHHERLELFLIPPQDSDFDRFRLETGQPIFINWKTHPYKDVELLEWGHRLQQAERFYSARSPGEACRQLSWLSRHYAVSAVVYAISHPIESGGCPLIEEIGHAGEYAIARVRAGP